MIRNRAHVFHSGTKIPEWVNRGQKRYALDWCLLEDTDIVIAGGGPAGLAAARAAAAGGASVAVFEKNSEIGSPTRTSGGSFIRDLTEIGIPPDLYHPVRVCRFLSPNKAACFALPHALACGIDVRRTYQWLAHRAIEAGARVYPATAVLDLTFDGKRPRGIRVKNARGKEFEISAHLIIDATGHRAALLRRAGVMGGHERFGVGAEYDLYAPHYNEDEIVLIVGSQVAPSGYAWALPWGNHRVRLGVGVIHPDSTAKPEDYLNHLMENADKFGMNLRGAQPVEFHTGLIPSDGVCERFVGDAILGAGDSAGQPSALLGEGIRWCIWAGEMAGQTAAEAVRAGDTSAAFLSRYERRWNSEHGTNLKIAAEINRRIANWSDERWDWGTELLASLTPAQFAQALKTEFTAGLGVSVLWSNPSLLKTGAREILRRAGI